MLMHQLSQRAPEWRSAGQHLPERHAERVQIRTDVYEASPELLGASELWGPGKNSGHRNRSLRKRFAYWLRQPKVDDLCGHSASLFQVHHDVAWFDIPVDEVVFVHRGQTGSDLRHDFECQLYIELAGAFD